MARNDVIKFVDQLSEYFGPPKPSGGQDDGVYLKTWMRYAIDDFGFYSAEELDRAFKILRGTSKYKSMPSNAEIIAACKDAVKELRSERPVLKVDTRSPQERSIQAKEDNALFLMRQSPMGKTACAEGWHGELFEFVRDNGRLPGNQHEIKILIEETHETDRTIERLNAPDDSAVTALMAVCRNFSQSILGRRDAIARAILDGEVYDWGRA